jgi:hypothetical protein
MARPGLSLTTLSACFLCALAAAVADAAAPAGLREIAGQHLTLVTDLGADPEVDALAGYFDQAFDQWCAYFEIDPAAHAAWRVQGCLMRTPERFRAAGLLPANLPDFAVAYSTAGQLWVKDQTSVYFRRHLLLHEGTHAFMHALVNGVGAVWYAEGVAELLATHRLEGGKLVLNSFPSSRDEAPKWGRIEVVQNGFAARRAKTLAQIFAYEGTIHGEIEPYGWCWAAAAFLDNHPRYRERFRSLGQLVGEADFAERVTQIFAADRDLLNEDWQLFVATIDYGYDFARMEVERTPGVALGPDGRRVEVAADRGWQSSGIELAPGTYRLRASGRYQVAAGPPPWMSEPGGVTIEYNQGRPLGMLLAAVREGDSSGSSGLVKPIAVGLGATLAVERPGVLYFRDNDSAGRLADNAGSARVEVQRE